MRSWSSGWILTDSEQEEFTGRERKLHPLLRVQLKGNFPLPREKRSLFLEYENMSNKDHKK